MGIIQQTKTKKEQKYDKKYDKKGAICNRHYKLIIMI